jgi:hypothetical protein
MEHAANIHPSSVLRSKATPVSSLQSGHKKSGHLAVNITNSQKVGVLALKFGQTWEGNCTKSKRIWK